MNRKQFFILSLFSLFAMFIAAIGIFSLPKNLSSDFDAEIVFPDLINNLDSLSSIILRDKESTFTLYLKNDTWVIKERNDFPVDTKKLGEFLVKLSRAQKVEPKTSMEDRYSRLDLDSVSSNKESRIKQVILYDKEGDELANLSIGKRKFTLGSNEGGTYVLFSDDPQAWLVTGEINPGIRVRDWVNRSLINIPKEKIKKVTITHPDGEILIVERDDVSEEYLSIRDIPKNKEPVRESITDDIGRTLFNLMFDDVAQVGKINFTKDKTVKVKFESFDGVNINISLVEDDDINWVEISGSYNEINNVKGLSNDEFNSEDWGNVVDDLNENAKGWVYQFPGYEVSGLKKRMEDLITDIEE
ncbi:MAG: DUF4340 domain-containing protein [Pseudomonadota bacterium]|nr:DUF4340 domain-containing protein [Pseudomonadota bacterium]